jgi:hypothetical protein
MSVFKEIAAAVAAVCALIFACDAVLGVGEARFDDDYYRASFYAPKSNEFRFASIPRRRRALPTPSRSSRPVRRSPASDIRRL